MNLHPDPAISNQIPPNPIKAIQIFPDPSKYVPISTRIQRNPPNPTNKNICPLQVMPSQRKSKRIDWNPLRSIQTARNHKSQKVQLDSPNQVHQIFLNLSEPTPTCHSCNHVKYAQIKKEYQIQQNLCKSTRIVTNPAATTDIYPNKTKPNPIIKLQRNPFKHVSINVHRTHRSSNHKIARFRQLHKQLQITQNSQHLI